MEEAKMKQQLVKFFWKATRASKMKDCLDGIPQFCCNWKVLRP